jgi:hypothetical protein
MQMRRYCLADTFAARSAPIRIAPSVSNLFRRVGRRCGLQY